MIPYNRKLLQFSQLLRNNSTSTERYLWSRLRLKQVSNNQFYRQKPIGEHIVDFYCPKAKLVIEIDGDSHFYQEGIEKDKTRDDYLRKRGLKVLRFSNSDITNNIEGVIQRIKDEVE